MSARSPGTSSRTRTTRTTSTCCIERSSTRPITMATLTTTTGRCSTTCTTITTPRLTTTASTRTTATASTTITTIPTTAEDITMTELSAAHRRPPAEDIDAITDVNEHLRLLADLVQRHVAEERRGVFETKID